MAKRTTYHVTKRPDGQWQTKAEGASRTSAVASTKAEVVDRSRELAKVQPLGQVVIHRSNGQIQTEHTYVLEKYIRAASGKNPGLPEKAGPIPSGTRKRCTCCRPACHWS